ncbi:hypothetical protein ANCDUO_09874 [Ancylostoma duodenale]|uniref:Reverse transcriptase domain-containing protein n=1 Tax=Ancylostoma duodenale TaxID=51022 RepID=A0A0C2GLS2_9BILA|nr:hypothetical protein ANCDUO_09874 [Ancylostoma duodenale]
MASIPIKDRSGKPLMTVEEQDERCMQNFREVLNQPDPPQAYNFGNEEESFDDLDVNTSDISIEETETAVRGLRNGKAPGLDEITAELLESGSRMLAEHLTRSLYLNSPCCVKTDNGHTGFFEITTGMRQGCILSAILFNIALDYVMRKAMKFNGSGIGWNNEGRLTASDYADDIALLAESNGKLQEATTSLNREAKKIGLRISSEKSKVMKIGTAHAPINIDVGDFHLENIARFTYLGSTVACDGDAEFDVRTRIAKAAAVFRKLQPTWATTSISNNIKMRLYLSIVIPTAIYASETWTMSARIIKRINGFHQLFAHEDTLCRQSHQ